MTPIVVLDTNVLYSTIVRYAILRAASTGRFEVRWSDQILDELTRNLVAKVPLLAERALSVRASLERQYPGARVQGFESLISEMKNHPKDRHVSALAVYVGAQVIVTSNTRDFTPLPGGIEAMTPDTFLMSQFTVDPSLHVELLRGQAQVLKRPPISFETFLSELSKMTPEFVRLVRAQMARE